MAEPNIQPTAKKATWRMGARQRERLQWSVVGVIIVLLIIAFRPYYLHIVETREFQTCQSNALKIAGSVRRYMEDYDGTLPLGPNWMTSTQGYIAATSGTGFAIKDIFHCPLDDTKGESSYAYNSEIGGFSADVVSTADGGEDRRKLLGHIDRAPMIFEKHGSGMNSNLKVESWNAFKSTLTRPHFAPQNTGTYITGNGKPSWINEEQLSNKSGKF